MQRPRSVAVVVATVLLIYIVSSFTMSSGGASQVAMAGEWAATSKTMHKNEYRIAIVADLDKKSKDETGKKFISWLKLGNVKKSGGHWSVEWDQGEPRTLKSGHNEAGRGMELSELVVFNDKLYTFDDRTGIVMEIFDQSKTSPVAMFIEGNGRGDKGQKSEWATVKDGVMYCGSFGKEYVGPQGEITSRNNLWVSTLSADGKVAHENWTEKYNAMRRTTNTVHPGYMIIETVVWSPVHRQWFVLPRRVSEQPYNEEEDERRGSNIVLRCNEQITSCEKFTVGTLTPERGFSTAKFVPGTDDTVMIALKSEEKEVEQTQATFITIFDIYGKTYVEETFIAPNKYEGLEFI